ncbi:hypothetical protein ASPCAL12138 [Aspergillus calidoustus]|uniref:Uncharacterized protein n=1 Tax=Aspergillus calidoustus TaxID=454130 RepID=A0A0U5G9N1_ASPCI|nr:hypothetical protein ASPCAL12138 [Aspergillus calidoustus]
MSTHNKPPSSPEGRINAARGYRAALNNPHVSAEAKEHARQLLLELDVDEARHELLDDSGPPHAAYHRQRKNLSKAEEEEDRRPRSPQERINAARGYKGALHNPLVSAEGKEHARRMLAEMHDEEAREELYRQHVKPKSPTRVAGGLRGAQHNPLVSEEARERAAQSLQEMGADSPEE